MKSMTQAEFIDLIMAHQRARKIFIESGLTNNISKAFSAYQELLAEQDRTLRLTTANGESLPKPGTHYRYLDIPCPVCHSRIYEMEKCCGAPEGWIECTKCDFQQKPSEFYKEM
jgi:hypothetical protein